MQIVYWDGQFNDSRFNIALAVTAALAGATVLNYAAVEGFLKARCTLRARRHGCAAEGNVLKYVAVWFCSLSYRHRRGIRDRKRACLVF